MNAARRHFVRSFLKPVRGKCVKFHHSENSSSSITAGKFLNQLNKLLASETLSVM
jgi:hypothetical protein